MTRLRIRDLGVPIGDLPPGENNAITDVAGVLVGHRTLISGEGSLQAGKGPVRTGVTVVLPHNGNLFLRKVRAGLHVINGFGKATGLEEIRELGVIESPIALTGTLNVGIVADALVQHCIRGNPDMGFTTHCVNVVVGETNDGFLNDIHGRHVRDEHVFAALASAASGRVAEGSVGAGTGAGCFGWKGGMGTASRVLPAHTGGFSLGVLVQSNLIGRPEDLIIKGVSVGKQFLPPNILRQPGGSIIIIIATDAPISSLQINRLCARAQVGLVRTGNRLDHGSGDFAVGFSTASPVEHRPASLTAAQAVVTNEAVVMQALFQAVAESVEEAVLNSMFCSETMSGRDGSVRYGLPAEKVAALVKEQGG